MSSKHPFFLLNQIKNMEEKNMSKMYLVKPDGIDAEWNATNYGENEYTQLSMKMIMPTEKSSETYGIF